MSTLGDKIVTTAAKYIGQAEIPLGSNKGPFVEKVLAFVHARPGEPWCAAFACWCASQAGVLTGPKTASTGGLYDWATAHGLVIYDPLGETPEDKGDPHKTLPGDFGLLIDNNSPTGYRHTTIIDHLIGDGSRVATIEGNLSDKVKRNSRDIHTLTIIRPYTT